jgi:hypothetical protein
MAQYEIFVDGAPSNSYQRITVLGFSVDDLVSRGIRALNPWAITGVYTFGPGTHTIDVRGANALQGGVTQVQLCGAAGLTTTAFLNIQVYR